MKKKEIGEKDIIRCLSNYENLLRDVRERIQYLYTSVATTNDVLESLQMHSGASGTFSGKKEKDLSDVLDLSTMTDTELCDINQDHSKMEP